MYGGGGIADIETDAKGDVIVIGNYSKTSNDVAEFAGVKLKEYRGRSCFIAKLNGKTGMVKWLKTGGDLNQGDNIGFAELYKIEIDKRGIIHFSGRFFRDANLDGIKVTDSKAIENSFIGKCDSSGQILAVKSFYDWYFGNSTMPIGHAGHKFKVDNNYNYVFTLVVPYQSRIIGKGLHYNNSTFKHVNVLLKFDSAANFIWMYKDTITHYNYASWSLAIDNDDNIYTFMKYGSYQCGFDKYNSNGKLIKSKKILGDKDTFFLTEFVTDNNKNIYANGMARGNFDFAGKNYDVRYEMPILVKFDSNLNEIWLRGSTEPYSGWGHTIKHNKTTENIFSSYQFNNKINFGKKTQGDLSGTPGILDKDFIGGFNPNGLNYWSKIGYISSNIIAFSEDNCGSLYVGVTGFKKAPNFDNIDLNFSYNYSSTSMPMSLIKYKFDTAIFTVSNFKDYCKPVKLVSVFDTSYHKLYWFYNGEVIDSFKNAITISFNKTGKYPVTLLGIKDNGCQYSYTDTITYIHNPQAKYSHKDIVGCQWLGYQFINQSTSDTIHSKKGESYFWDFGDGTTDTAKNPLHIFTKSGKFNISLIYSNGFCSDTFTQEQTVEILAAPKPGFIVNDTDGCAPFTVNVKDHSQGVVAKYTYSFGKEHESNEASPTYTFTKPGIYYITQKLLGATGCITSDSVRIRIRAGILPDENPEMLRATFINNNQVEISWKKHPLAKHYNLYKQYDKNDFVLIQKHFPDTIYMDQTVSLAKPFRYYIQATDSCDNLSAQSLIAQPVILHGENKDNTILLLNYTPYDKWQNGVKEYVLQYQLTDDSFTAISNSASFLQTDSFRAQSPNGMQCYRILAVEMDGNKQESYSNTVCLPHIPQVYVPNAFSPNNDAVNDIFSISAIGITESNINIYNRWGEKIYQNQQGESINWDGNFKSAPAPDDVYIYTLQLLTIHGKKIYQTGNIHLNR